MISFEDIIKKYNLEYFTTWNTYGLHLYGSNNIDFFEIKQNDYLVRNKIEWDVIYLITGKQSVRIRIPHFYYIDNTEELDLHIENLYGQFTELAENYKRIQEFNKLKDIEDDFS